MEEKPKFMPVKDYATLKSVSVQAVYKMIRQNKVETKKIGSFTLVRG